MSKEHLCKDHDTSNEQSDSNSTINASISTEELDYDLIDYSTAFRRENQRRQTSEELMKLNADVYKRSQAVLTGFVNETMTHEGVSNNEVVFDVLPSFEMYRSLQYSTAPAGEELGQLPPDYVSDSTNPTTNIVTPEYYEPISSATDSSTRSSSVSASFQDLATSSSSVSHYFDESSPLESDPLDKNMLDNVHKLPKLKNPDIQVQVHVTKNVPTPYAKCEPEAMLKEYTSGDVVHGYITISNRTNRRIPFNLFTVTLEGSVSIVDVQGKKQVIKNFLNMIDLSASWSYACISPSANLTYKPGSQDYDGCYLGLRNDRTLEPNCCYKKFFTFKFPYNTLDTTCRHGQELHTLLPPSLGVNKIKHKGRYANIQVNPVLGYGHNSKKGSPVLTRDLSNDLLSINYSINAVLVGVNPNDQKTKKLYCLAESEYALRFIPFGFSTSIFSSQKSLNYLKQLTEQTFKTAERGLKLTLEGNQKGVQELDSILKLEQLRLNPNAEQSSVNQTSNYFPLRNQNHATPDFSKVETGLTYISNTSNNLLNKFKSNYDCNRNGFISITTSLPKDGLPYISPSLIKKTNEISKLNNLGIANYNLMNSSLSTNEKKKLTSINIQLKFSPSDHRVYDSAVNNIEPPKIKFIDTKLIVMNVYSSASIPIKLSSDIFLDKNNDSFKKLKNDFKKYDEEYERIAKDFEIYGLDIENFIPTQVTQDIKAMKDLKCDSYLLSVLEHAVEGYTNWKKVNDKSKTSQEWTQSLQLNLDFKDQIQETLIPTFQTCLLSRHYSIQVEIGFKSGQSASLRIPVRLRQFDGN